MAIPTHYRALVVSQPKPKSFVRAIIDKDTADLGNDDLLVKVQYSSLNYKDALSATGHPGVTRQFPHTPGIDAAGEVISCDSGAFSPGDQVLITGFDLGMETDGGWGELIRIPSSWAVSRPQELSARSAMALGTAGFTAALSLQALERSGVLPDAGEIVVTGASGGVGSLAVGMLAKRGYQVVAVSGKPEKEPLLRALGATQIISREELIANNNRPLLPERWAGGIDVAGGELLSAVLKTTRYGGTVTCCGLVGSADLNINVFPFILRGVTLCGIDSVNYPLDKRGALWQRMATELYPDAIEPLVREITLEQLEDSIQAMLAGETAGRIVVRHG